MAYTIEVLAQAANLRLLQNQHPQKPPFGPLDSLNVALSLFQRRVYTVRSVPGAFTFCFSPFPFFHPAQCFPYGQIDTSAGPYYNR